MKSICFYFQVHQPLRLKTYRFFNMGTDHHYLDDGLNRAIIRKVADKCYMPMNDLLLRLINQYRGEFRVSFSISGIAIEQFRMYAPEVLESFRELSRTGCVEFLAETYCHSLASLIDKEEFISQVEDHREIIVKEFGQRPEAFRNTELIYSDDIAATVSGMGFKTMLAEGAKHIMGWKSPNYVYVSSADPELRLLLRNYRLSDDIAFRFSDRGWEKWPLTVEKYLGWLSDEDVEGDIINLFMDYETFGEHQDSSTGIFEFMEKLPGEALKTSRFNFRTVTEASSGHDPVGTISSPYPMSWADEERDVTAWLGNEMQNEAFPKLYALKEKIRSLNDSDFEYAWKFLQVSDHFYYMATKWLSDGDVHTYFNPYGSSYESFINYMNVLSDFGIELDKKLRSVELSKTVIDESVPYVVDVPLKTIAKPKSQKIQKRKKTVNTL